MAKTLQLRRGTSATLNAITGAEGELFVDLDNDTVRVHDGVTQGGIPLVNQTALDTKVNSTGGGYVNNAITRYDGTTGTAIQNSLVTIADTGAITAPNNTGSMIPFYYPTLASFPTAANSHGAVAHAHDTGKMYYAHAGVWIELANMTDVGSGGGGGVALTDFSATTPIVYNNTTGAFSHATSGVNANAYGAGGTGGVSIITIPRITVNNTGHITSVSDEYYFPPTRVITGIYVNDQIIQGSSFDPYRPLAIVAGDNVTLSATQSGASGYPELTISATGGSGGGGGVQTWYNAVATTSPDTTLETPADWDYYTHISEKLVVGGNDPSFTSGAQPSPGSWTSYPATSGIGGTIYTNTEFFNDPPAPFTVSSGTGGYRWIMTPNNTEFSTGSLSFAGDNSGSGTTVSYPSNGLPSLPSNYSLAAEVNGVVQYDANGPGPGALTATNCTIHEEVTANNVTYVFWSMTKAQSDNVFFGQAMITSTNFASFVTIYFYKQNF